MNFFEKLLARWFAYKSKDADYPYKVRLAVSEKIILEGKIMDILRNKSVKNLPLEGLFEPKEIEVDYHLCRYIVIVRLKDDKVIYYEIHDSIFTDYVDVYYGMWKDEDLLDALIKQMQKVKPLTKIQSFEISFNKLSEAIREREKRKKNLIGYNVVCNSIGKKVIDTSFFTGA